jgi:alpha-D-xyloside xylohydrolase
MRGLVMDFPDDPKVRDIDDEYLFGPSFLVAPVTDYQARSRDVYLPAGSNWYDFYTGKPYQGGQTIKADAPLDRMPLFVRAGAIVPVGPAIQYTNEKPDAPITLFVYTGANGTFSMYKDQGTTYDYEHGAFARVPFSYDEASATLTIGKREGSYPGMPAERTFNIRWIAGPTPTATDFEAKPAQSVHYDGTAITVHKDASKQ